ncbi:MAG: riboflavin synthase [Phycisphaerales bacterium]|nr:riboflavin synthase [Phycisphaerales bacterium]
MFTGIVEYRAVVKTIEERPFGLRLVVDIGDWDHRPAQGESIAVSGVCLTAVAESLSEDTVAFDVITETLNFTTLGDLTVGGAVNLEHSMRSDTLMGGHVVQGHVDGVGVYTEIQKDAEDYRITIRPPAELMEYIIPKGSVSTDGVSMTVAAVTRDTFTLALIPTTLDLTTLGLAKVGGRCNIETDIISRTVVHWLRNYRDVMSEAPRS